MKLSVWQIPSTSQAWKFKKAEFPLALGAYVTAPTDGFVNGVVKYPGMALAAASSD